MKQDKQRLANKPFGEIVSDGFRLFFQTYSKIIIPFALFYIAYIIVSVFLLGALQANLYDLYIAESALIDRYNANPFEAVLQFSDQEYSAIQPYVNMNLLIAFLDGIILGVFTALSLCTVSSFLYKTHMEENPSFSDEFISSFNSKLLIVVLVLGVGVSVCFGYSLFLMIPGIIIFCFFIFLVYTYNMKDVDRPFMESRLSPSGNYIKIIGVFLLAQLIFSLFDLITIVIRIFIWNVNPVDYTYWYTPAGGMNFGMIITRDIVYSIITILISPLFICLLTPVFAVAKAQKDIGYRRKKQQYMSWGTQYERQPASGQRAYEPERGYSQFPATRTRAQPQSGFYCPFCGTLIRSPKKFCPNCGETVDFKGARR